MINLNKIKVVLSAITFATIVFAGTASAQKYKTAADTVKLNKEYGDITLEISKLNSKLIEKQNKIAGYQAKSASTAQDAVGSAQESKETASTATDGSTADAKTAMKQARKANNDADDARDAVNNQKQNDKDIKDISEKIQKKQMKLADLAKQKAAILASITPQAVQQ